MLNSIQSLQTRLVGAVDTNTNKVIVPISYNAVYFQKYGITACKKDGMFDVYLLDGTNIINNALNPLFLADNLILIASASKTCFIYDYKKKKPVYNANFDSVLFFMGSKPQAIQYTPVTNFSPYFTNPDYLEHGAHLEKLVCARHKNKWGVINRLTSKLYCDFKYKVIVQCKDGQIAVRGENGSTVLL